MQRLVERAHGASLRVRRGHRYGMDGAFTSARWPTQRVWIVAGNEPSYVGSPSDSHSLSLPAGSSATSPAVCPPHLVPFVRFFLRNSGNPNAHVHVELLRGNGGNNALDAGSTSGSTEWSLSPQMRPDLRPGQTGVVRFRLTAVGAGASFTVDDVYYDPYKPL